MTVITILITIILFFCIMSKLVDSLAEENNLEDNIKKYEDKLKNKK